MFKFFRALKVSKVVPFLIFPVILVSHSAFAENKLICKSSSGIIPAGYIFNIQLSGKGKSANLHVSAPHSDGDFKYDSDLTANVSKLNIQLPPETVVISGQATVTYPDAPAEVVDGMYFVQSHILEGLPGILTVLTGADLSPVQYMCK